ncbi:hypothetical protein [Alicyclobacillus acidoterrestris]|uniref:Uncharacterized protein n=1 Tax=Alicyclobacillus acidoterrestris (strain ATCC 49025 / DSM 3922 / CIP 106132 / NCIMB 13137 / GD3B) TaxID=1356854 RepID=T0DE62_ALIAG|nr:hypothetical protein [Alicyclobacillus acidoterrestris]EPZ47906.1 hypothetical protein N007_04925 [Alicyclobacillus acidoterrestris ATCC 49025]UNO51028.1 hypothetical protein K1I37_21420 [Alicyclobacillus acidoterrestris]
MKVIYDISALPEMKDIIAPLEEKHGIRLASQNELAQQQVETLKGQRAISSDMRFEDKTDEYIIQQLQQFIQIGLKMYYIAAVRETDEFKDALSKLGVTCYFITELTIDGARKWLDMAFVEEGGESTDSSAKNPVFQHISHVAVQQKEERTTVPTRAIVVSGASGAGSTFIGLQVAKRLSQANHVNYVEAGLRPCLTTWYGVSDADEAKATLSEPVLPAIEDGNLRVYTRNPFGDEAISLRAVTETITHIPGVAVYDMALQDYLASVNHSFAQETVRVLVTNTDLHRCRYLESLPADIVVVNMAPTRLPIDEAEFEDYWPNAKVVFVPYEPEQSLAVVQGQPVILHSTGVQTAIHKLVTHIEGGVGHADSLVG